MTLGIICALSAGLLYLAKRWRDLRAENVQLRAQVESLKRQMTKYGRARGM